MDLTLVGRLSSRQSAHAASSAGVSSLHLEGLHCFAHDEEESTSLSTSDKACEFAPFDRSGRYSHRRGDFTKRVEGGDADESISNPCVF